MAFNLRRFLAWFGVGAAVIIAAILGGVDAIHGPTFNEFSLPIREARWRGSRIARAVSALELRDSVSAALRARPAPKGLSIVLPNGATPAWRNAVSAGLREQWQLRVGQGDQYPVVFLVRDRGAPKQATPFDFSPIEVILTQEDAGGNACVIEFRASGFQPPVDGPVRAPSLGNWLGVCSFFARYGAPGAGTARWLKSESWRQAGFAPLRSASAGPSPAPFEGQPRSSGGFARAGNFGVRTWFSERDQPWYIGAHGAGCLARNDAACMELLTPPVMVADFVHASLLPRSIAQSRFSFGGGYAWRRGLMTEIEKGLGEEKFAQFWKSESGPVESLAGLYPGGATALIHDRLTESAKPLSRNPWPSVVEWVVQLGLAGAAIGLMAMAARTRTMTA
jgi:hypothetical protein